MKICTLVCKTIFKITSLTANFFTTFDSLPDIPRINSYTLLYSPILIHFSLYSIRSWKDMFTACCLIIFWTMQPTLTKAAFTIGNQPSNYKSLKSHSDRLMKCVCKTHELTQLHRVKLNRKKLRHIIAEKILKIINAGLIPFIFSGYCRTIGSTSNTYLQEGVRDHKRGPQAISKYIIGTLNNHMSELT